MKETYMEKRSICSTENAAENSTERSAGGTAAGTTKHSTGGTTKRAEQQVWTMRSVYRRRTAAAGPDLIRYLFPGFLFCLLLSSCNYFFDFEQPSVTITSYALAELPTPNWIDLEVDVLIHNNDRRDAHVTTITYTAILENNNPHEVTSEKMTHSLNKTITAGNSIAAKLPLRLPTAEAAGLLLKLDKSYNIDQKLQYTVTGTIHTDRTFGKELDLNTAGEAPLESTYEDFFGRPAVEVNSYTITEVSYSDTFDLFNLSFDGKIDAVVTLNAEATVTNTADFAANITNLEYTVEIEGVLSETAAYSTDFFLAAEGGTADLSLTDIQLTDISYALVYGWLIGSEVPFIVTGMFTADINLGAGEETFVLPLYAKGNIVLDVADDVESLD